MNIDETFDKLKIKFVIKNFSQKFDVNYKNIFIFTIRFNIFKLFFVIVTFKNLKCYQINVNNVFMKFFLKNIIYVKSSSNVILFFK